MFSCSQRLYTICQLRVRARVSQDRDRQMWSKHGVDFRAVPHSPPWFQEHLDFAHSAIHQKLHQGRNHHDQSRVYAWKEKTVPVFRHRVIMFWGWMRVKTDSGCTSTALWSSLMTFNKLMVCVHRVVSLRCCNLRD